jgi:caa(3)-type oxidase subunit IV
VEKTMSANNPEAIQKHVRIYWMVFAALAVGTIITVAVANVHLALTLAIIVALIVASVKGTLVAGFFMHLFHERKWVYGVLILTAVFALAMVVLIAGAYKDQRHGAGGVFKVPAKLAVPHGTEQPH